MQGDRMRFVTLLLVAASVGYLATGHAAAPVAKTDSADQIVSKICSACHATDGNSVSPANPVLAGQHAEYIAKQLANFKSGERKNPVMLGMSSTLAPEDMIKLGEYFQQQKPKPRAAKDPELVKAGQQIYRGGIMAKGVAACTSCHGPTGAGIPAQYPRVAGQYAEYITAQLVAFRSGERANDPNKTMRTVAVKLSDTEIKAVAEYMVGLR
jgi:cytochrome c553